MRTRSFTERVASCVAEQSMKILVYLLACSAVLACMGGCIPIGVRGSTMAAAPSCVAGATAPLGHRAESPARRA
jgi:hypothetical protein